MKLDIGCGARKRPGYYGIDRVAMPGVNWVGDLNDPLPFPDDSVDDIAVCRMLPYVDDLTAAFAELYRIGRHGTVLTLLCPYAHHFRHGSNPYLKHRFDERTPRYLTPRFRQPEDGPLCPPIEPYGYVPPLPYDFRLLRMELFYDAAFSPPLYEPDELELLKELQANVVDEILYRFVIVKGNMPDDEWRRLCRLELSEPHAVLQLRTERHESAASASYAAEDPHMLL